MKVFEKSFATVNGKAANSISVFDHGFLYGDGIFDTFRIFNGQPFYMEKHIDRLFSSAGDLNLHISYSKKELRKLIEKTYKKFRHRDAFVRVIVTRGEGPQGIFLKTTPNIIVICEQRAFRPLRKVDATISEIKKYSKDVLRSVKSLNYEQHVKALYDAKKQEFDEAILLNELNFLVEATTSNIFLVKNKKLFTPSLKSGALPGITREIILKKFSVKEKELTTKELLSADEVFLTGTVDFVTCLKRIDKVTYTQFDFANLVFKKISALIKK